MQISMWSIAVATMITGYVALVAMALRASIVAYIAARRRGCAPPVTMLVVAILCSFTGPAFPICMEVLARYEERKLVRLHKESEELDNEGPTS